MRMSRAQSLSLQPIATRAGMSKGPVQIFNPETNRVFSLPGSGRCGCSFRQRSISSNPTSRCTALRVSACLCMHATCRCPVNYRVGLFVRVPENQAAKSVSWWRCAIRAPPFPCAPLAKRLTLSYIPAWPGSPPTGPLRYSRDIRSVIFALFRVKPHRSTRYFSGPCNRTGKERT